MAESAATVLLLEDSADAAATQLLDLMGDGAAEDIMMLMENRCTCTPLCACVALMCLL